MAIPNLDDWTDKLDRTCRDYLAETIQYKIGAGAYAGKGAHVNYRDAVKPLEGAAAIEQDITVAVMIEDLPTMPVGADRVQLAKRPGKTFRPINPRRDDSGTHWEFEVVQVNG
jgi:hypothetical protein